MVKIFDKQAILENRIKNLEDEVENLKKSINILLLNKWDMKDNSLYEKSKICTSCGKDLLNNNVCMSMNCPFSVKVTF